MSNLSHTASNRLRHFFHVVSNVRPIVWIGSYVAITPIFALIYWVLPDTQFRIPDGSGTDFGSWLYYSIVTITTLGFGDYTPAHGWAQAVTAIEVMCGLVLLGFFLNAVGSMKSELDVDAEIQKQQQAHQAVETDKLKRQIPSVLHRLNIFLSYCYAVTTPASQRGSDENTYNPDFTVADMRDMFNNSGLPVDRSHKPAVQRLIASADHTSLLLDSLQSRVDLGLWPQVVDDCFAFVAGDEMFASDDSFPDNPDKELIDMIANFKGTPERNVHGKMKPVIDLYYFIKENAAVAIRLENRLTQIASGNVQDSSVN